MDNINTFYVYFNTSIYDMAAQLMFVFFISLSLFHNIAYAVFRT